MLLILTRTEVIITKSNITKTIAAVLAGAMLLTAGAFAADAGVVTARTGLYMRTGPSVYSSALTVLPLGTNVSVEESSNGWLFVEAEGLSGWMCGDYIEIIPNEQEDTDYPLPAPSVSEQLVACAGQYIGCPYSWGAVGPERFDCSGLMQTVYAECGYTLDRTAAQQMQQGEEVELDALRTGDLLFFAMNGGSTASHVGMYVGGGEFIHASSSRGVRIQELNDYYLARYIGARRIINTEVSLEIN